MTPQIIPATPIFHETSEMESYHAGEKTGDLETKGSEVESSGNEGEVGGLSYENDGEQFYKQYWYRWVGLFGITLTNFAVGMNTLWFAAPFVPILIFFELEVYPLNWTFNIANISLIVMGCFVPVIVQRIGVKYTCWGGTLFLLMATWLRVGATHDVAHGYPILVAGQIFLGFGSCLLGIIGPKFVEIWFNETSRTSATAIYSVGGVAGQLIAQLAAPRLIVDETRVQHGILVCAIMTTVFCLSAFGVLSKPPTPPTFTAATSTLPFLTTVKTLLGLKVEGVEGREPMRRRERVDVLILTICWSLITGTIATQQTFIAQILVPLGYTAETAGVMGGVVIGSGVLFAICLGPVFDRIRHLALVIKVFGAGFLAACIGFVFAAKPANDASLYVVMIFLGALAFSSSPREWWFFLPSHAWETDATRRLVVLELGSELVRSPETTTMIFTVGAGIWSIASVEIVTRLINPVDGTLRGGLVYMAVVSGVSIACGVWLKGDQRRKQTDITKRLAVQPPV
ncbi:major facilitator superfamily domain-containing protein [Mrakia frigida]|uniref:major facilitator superfamily domain-containing protein n=1 Tax=Mrakia frigida TaxID=29902 RepID=UPI003FCBFB83